MSDRLDIMIDGAIVRIAVHGDMTSARYGEILSAVYKNPDFQPGMGILLRPAKLPVDIWRTYHLLPVLQMAIHWKNLVKSLLMAK